MAKQLEVYKCVACGNIVEILTEGSGDLNCCGEQMQHLAENTVDAAKEKHVPVMEKTNSGYKVSVGSVAHPMDEKHFIEWIELIADNKVYRKHLKPGQEPEATFCTNAEKAKARAYCNLHGLWKA